MTASIWKKVTTLKQSRYFFVEIRTPGERSALLFLVLVFLFQGIETIHLLKHGGRDVERRIGVEQGIGIDDEFVTTIGIKVLDGAVQQVLSPVREDENSLRRALWLPSVPQPGTKLCGARCSPVWIARRWW